MTSFYTAQLSGAACAADMSVGSERGRYVPMSHVFPTLGRPHRAINIMFCYYPFIKGWPKRASLLEKRKPGAPLWSLPYDDYEPLVGLIEQNPRSEVIRQMRDVRRFGQDVNLTLTIDAKTPVKTLRAMAKSLRPHGRVFFRINHECNGNWFKFNKLASYPKVNDFFVRFHEIVKEEAPLAQTVLCLNGSPDVTPASFLKDNAFHGAVRAADIIGIDYYFSLFYGWPNKKKNTPRNWYSLSLKDWWRSVKRGSDIINAVRRRETPITLPEMDADSDCDGLKGQSDRVRLLYEFIRDQNKIDINGVTFYQFRDYAGLGLERENPATGALVRVNPVMATYKKLSFDPHFLPRIIVDKKPAVLRLPAVYKWWNSEKAEGLTLCGTRSRSAGEPAIVFGSKVTCLIRCNGRWFHGDNVARVSLKGAVARGSKFTAVIFFPPADGLNTRSGNGYLDHFAFTLSTEPTIDFTGKAA